MKHLKNTMKRDAGFTLIEMSLVLFIVSTLLLLFIPNLSTRQKTADETGTEAVQTVLQSQADLYLMEETLPITFEEMKDKNYLTTSQFKEADDRFSIDGEGIITKKAVSPDSFD